MMDWARTLSTTASWVAIVGSTQLRPSFFNTTLQLRHKMPLLQAIVSSGCVPATGAARLSTKSFQEPGPTVAKPMCIPVNTC